MSKRREMLTAQGRLRVAAQKVNRLSLSDPDAFNDGLSEIIAEMSACRIPTETDRGGATGAPPIRETRDRMDRGGETREEAPGEPEE